MVKKYLSDNDIFGAAPTAAPTYLSDDDIFSSADSQGEEEPGFISRMMNTGSPASTVRGMIDAFFPEKEEAEQTRLESAGGGFAQGAGQMASQAMKGAALVNTPSSTVMQDLTRIDQGKAPRGDLQPIPGIPGEFFDPNEQFYEEYTAASPEERQKIRASLESQVTDAMESPAYQAGKNVDQWFKENFPTDPAYQDEFFAGKLPGALGSATTFVLSSAVTRGATSRLGPAAKKISSYATPTVLGSTANSASQFEDALASGADIETALKAAELGRVVGTTEGVPIGNLLNRLDKGSGGAVKNYLIRVTKQGSEEAVQEAFNGIMNAAIAQNLYDPQRGIWTDERIEEGALGLTTGVLLETLVTLLPGRSTTPANALAGELERTLSDGEWSRSSEDVATDIFSAPTEVVPVTPVEPAVAPAPVTPVEPIAAENPKPAGTYWASPDGINVPVQVLSVDSTADEDGVLYATVDINGIESRIPAAEVVVGDTPPVTPTPDPAPEVTNFTPADSPTKRAGMVDIVVPKAGENVDVSTTVPPGPVAPNSSEPWVDVNSGGVELSGSNVDSRRGSTAAPGILGAGREIVSDTRTVPELSTGVEIWTGRSGNGYADAATAKRQIPKRDKAYDWSVEQTESGRYILRGVPKDPQQTVTPAVNTAAPVDNLAPLPTPDLTPTPTPSQPFGDITDQDRLRSLTDIQKVRTAVWQWENRMARSGTPVPRMKISTPSQKKRDAVMTLGKAFSELFDRDIPVYAFTSSGPGSVEGFTINGVAMVNVTKEMRNPRVQTTGHEVFHTMEVLAEMERNTGLTDTPAQRFVERMYSIFDDISVEGKREYIQKYLERERFNRMEPSRRDAVADQAAEGLKGVGSPRSEMIADFFGNRMNDKSFWKDLAKTDPTNFASFVDRFIKLIDDIVKALKTLKSEKTYNAKVDEYVRDLNKAKMTARDALVAYRREMKAQQAKPKAEPGSDNNLVSQATPRDEIGTGQAFTGFFSNITEGLKGRPGGKAYEPVLDLSQVQEFADAYTKYRGNFDDHIGTSIPTFRDLQIVVGDAIVKAYPQGDMLDIGASEGALIKTITELSNGGVRTVGLDPNFAMAKHFNSTQQVDGSVYVTEAFGTESQAGEQAWIEKATLVDRDGDTRANPYAGRRVRFYKPDRQFDIIHEAMALQFIDKNRAVQIRRMKELLKADGVVVLEEKFIPGEGLTEKQFKANEKQKDDYKEQYFTKDEIAAKAKAVGVAKKREYQEEQDKAEEQVVGMADLMVPPGELESVMKDNFQHVVQFWDSGNFKGYIGSDSREAIDRLLDNMQDTDSEFSTVDTPRWVAEESQFSDTRRENEQQAETQPTRDRAGREAGGRSSRGEVQASGREAQAQVETQLAPLDGVPNVRGFHGPDPQLVAVAEQYAKDNGIDFKRQDEYVEVDVDRARRIAKAYEEMSHAPQDPRVQEAYQDLIDQTLAQYNALVDAGYQFWFTDLDNPSNVEYLSTPWNAMRDIRANKTMGVFPTDGGFGSSDLDVNDNPLLEDTGLEWPVGGLDGPMKPVLANDLFRAVHDAFGHGLEGAGFRARGEENAWQAHVRLFTGPAVGAITSETRGQNSWLNYGPHGEANRTAATEDTVFADQKTGLMPEWTWQEGRVGDEAETQATSPRMQQREMNDEIKQRFDRYLQAGVSGLEGAVQPDGRVELIHYSHEVVKKTDPTRYGRGLSRTTERQRLKTALPRTYFGIESADINPYRREFGLGTTRGRFLLDGARLYNLNQDLDGFRQGQDVDDLEREIVDAGYAGYFVNHPTLGKIAAVFESLELVEPQMQRGQGDMFPGEFASSRTSGAVDSSGQVISPTVQGVERFWRWFGDSEATDNQGRPLVFYHTTRNDFSEFEPGRPTVNSWTFGELETSRAAVFFTESLEDSQAYGSAVEGEFDPGANVMPVYLKTVDMLDTLNGISESAEKRLTDAGMNLRYIYNLDWSVFDGEEGVAFVEQLRKAGYDSVKFWDENPDTGDNFEAVAVFSPTQIKSAIGNRGTFNETNPDIRFQAPHVIVDDFYSNLARKVQGGPNQAPRDQWKGYINGLKTKGVKAEEIQWSGVMEWLDLQDGKVTKDAITQYLGQHGVRVEEIMLSDAESDATQYDSYQMDGGIDYRELLLTLPYTGEPWQVYNTRTEEIVSEFKTEREAGEEARRLGGHFDYAHWSSDNQRVFTSSHWSDPNVMAHIRMNTRTDVDGNQVLFIEEIQSDWAQEGRKKGFQKGKSTLTMLNELTQAVYNTDYESATPAEREWARDNLWFHKDSNVPFAPFVQNTDAWVTLSVKRIIAEAVNSGVDKVAFITGQQSADRYDLSKQVDAVYAIKEKGDLYTISVQKDRERSGLADVLLEEFEIPITRVEELVGKELAEKIQNQTEKEAEYRGVDLKVGGKGMIAFYDKIVPKVVQKVLKSLGGGKLETVDLNNGSGSVGFTVTDEMRQSVYEIGIPLFQQSVLTDGEPLSTWTLKPNTRTDSALYRLQDKHIDTKHVVEAIGKIRGEKLEDRWDPYLREELYHKRVAKRLKDFVNDEVHPIMVEAKAMGITVNELETYLHNRHAGERNRKVAERREDLPDGGSGIMTEAARKWLDGLDSRKRSQLEKLAARVDKVIKGTQKVLVDGGLEKQETIDGWNEMFDHYVPLFREESDFESGFLSMGTGSGFSTSGSSSKHFTGSTRQVTDIFANVVMARERAITRAEKNKVAVSLYGLAAMNPNRGFWFAVNPDVATTEAGKRRLAAELEDMGLSPEDALGIVQEPRHPVFDPATGKVIMAINPLLRKADNVMVARINGADRFVFFNKNDERAARMVAAMKNLDAQHAEILMSTIGVATRWLAQVNTQYNPVFGVVNLVRDLGTGALNLTTTEIAGEQAAVIGGSGPAAMAIMSNLRAHRSGKKPKSGDKKLHIQGKMVSWNDLWEMFEKAGGTTGYRDMWTTSRERAEALEKDMRRLVDGNILGNSARGAIHMLSDFNETLENAVRLSAFKVALEKGMTVDRAASLAKNLTVNFNRKGTWTSAAGSFYAFFNAGIQGNYRMLQTLASPAGKKIITGGIFLGFLQEFILAAMGYDEDDPPGFIRERAFVIPLPEGNYAAIPYPLGFNILPNLGRYAMNLMLTEGEDTTQKTIDIVVMVAESFNPLGSAPSVTHFFAPTALDPIVSLEQNINWTGLPIYQEDFGNQRTPGHTRGRDSATAHAILLSHATNWMTGGDQDIAGKVSPTPEHFDYLVGEAFGGVGRESTKVAQTVTSIAAGTDLPPYQIPLVGRFWGQVKGVSSESSKFYNTLANLQVYNNKVKGMEERGEPVGDYLDVNPLADPVLYKKANREGRRLAKLRKERNQLVSDGAPKAEVQRIEKEIELRLSDFNREVDGILKKKPNLRRRLGDAVERLVD